ncbi:hypothetical protein SSX86_030055 [Deinandra increscens subsp. villosa]|uniref:Uncharacterized protein n=1 Tax=Deinandra increscens subsp. villosa TaxID=3103831 RepID=A0AAP0CCI1_9ASTR
MYKLEKLVKILNRNPYHHQDLITDFFQLLHSSHVSIVIEVSDCYAKGSDRRDKVVIVTKSLLSNCLSETNIHQTVPALRSKTRIKFVVGLNTQYPQYKKFPPWQVSIMQIATEKMVFNIDLIKLSNKAHAVVDIYLIRIFHLPCIIKHHVIVLLLCQLVGNDGGPQKAGVEDLEMKKAIELSRMPLHKFETAAPQAADLRLQSVQLPATTVAALRGPQQQIFASTNPKSRFRF